MAKRKRTVAELPTIWRCPDDLRKQVICPVLDSLDPPKRRQPDFERTCTLNAKIPYWFESYATIFHSGYGIPRPLN